MADQQELTIVIKRVVDQAGAAADRAEDAAKRKRIAEELAARKQASREAAAAAKAASKQAADAALAAAAAIKQAEKEKADATKQAAKEQTAAEKQAAKESEAAARRRLATVRQTIRESERLERELFAEGRRIEKERAAAEAKAESDSVRRSKASFQARAKIMQDTLTAQKSALAAAAVLYSSVEGVWHKANTLALEAVDKVVGYRKALIELATLRPGGKPGQTGPELKQNLAISQATGLSLEGVAGLTTKAYAGASSFLDEGGVKGLMSPEEYAKAVQTAGKFGAVMGGDAGDYGAAAALIPVLAGKRIDSKQFESELLRYDKMATSAGVANPALLFGAMQKNVGYASSGVLSGAELGGLTAGYSQTSGAERAAERVQQAISAVSAGLVRDRGGNIADEFKDQAGTTADYFKRLGITQQTGTMDRLKTIASDVNKQKAADKSFNANEYLSLQGFGNEGSRAAIMEFAGNVDSGRYGRSIEPLITQKFAPGTVDQRFNEAVRTDPVMRQNIVDANTQLTDVIAGEPLVTQNQARQLAYNQLKASGKARGSFEDYVNPPPMNVFSPSSWGEGIGRWWHGVGTGALDSIANKSIAGQANAMGLGDQAAMFGASQLTGLPGSQWFTSQTMQQKAAPVNDITGAITAAGGDAFGDLRKAAEAQLKAAQMMLDANKPNGKVPAPAATKPPTIGRP